MMSMTAAAIRMTFVNCSKGEAKRIRLPNLDEVAWEDLDFLGWHDPSGSQRAYLVMERSDRWVGLVLRQSTNPTRVGARSTMCQLCVTPHTGGGVTMTVARKAGASGKKGDSTGLYVCRDLACSLYIRGKRVSGAPRLRETISQEASVARCRRNLDTFVDRVLETR